MGALVIMRDAKIVTYSGPVFGREYERNPVERSGNAVKQQHVGKIPPSWCELLHHLEDFRRTLQEVLCNLC